jgi:hypothetical protein
VDFVWSWVGWMYLGVDVLAYSAVFKKGRMCFEIDASRSCYAKVDIMNIATFSSD